jgi:hypothetical protein
MRAAIAIFLALTVAGAVAQTDARARYTGCVMKDMDGNITFCEPEHCSMLTGKDVGVKLAGHTVVVEGTVKEAGDGEPRRIVVSRIVSVGAACNQSCALYPVHHRGIGGRDKPGSEGGTPGVSSQQPH